MAYETESQINTPIILWIINLKICAHVHHTSFILILLKIKYILAIFSIISFNDEIKTIHMILESKIEQINIFIRGVLWK